VSEQRQKTGGRQKQATTADSRNICGPQIRRARQQRHPRLLLADLSALVRAEGVMLDLVALSKIERGQREVTDFELKAIAASLNLPIKVLVDEQDPV
jgi:HTH-type transcriptional regulator, cell division transcriptional repressor